MGLLDPFAFDFMQRALAEVALMGTACGLLGSLVLLRGLVYSGESLSHVLLPGGAVALVAGGSALGGALVSGVLGAAAVAWLLRRRDVDEDTAIGVAVTGAFAAGVILLSTRGVGRDLESLLFGNILAVRPRDLWLGLGAAALVLVLVLASVRGLLLVAFDREFARASGHHVGRLDLLLLVSLAGALAVGLSGMGTLLVLALLVAPAATARVVARRPWTMLWLAPALALAAGVAGLELSYHAGVAAGPAIGLAAIAEFVLAAGLAGYRRARRDAVAVPA
jgi:ABC-type Mn2+/Zn2+ transport system permease subunit